MTKTLVQEIYDAKYCRNNREAAQHLLCRECECPGPQEDHCPITGVDHCPKREPYD